MSLYLSFCESSSWSLSSPLPFPLNPEDHRQVYKVKKINVFHCDAFFGRNLKKLIKISPRNISNLNLINYHIFNALITFQTIFLFNHVEKQILFERFLESRLLYHFPNNNEQSTEDSATQLMDGWILKAEFRNMFHISRLS